MYFIYMNFLLNTKVGLLELNVCAFFEKYNLPKSGHEVLFLCAKRIIFIDNWYS